MNRALDDDALWYRDAVIYELRVRSFFDSDGDGLGDFRGLTQKLDYLQDLGVDTLWLLPFYPSPLRDDGYDIADYESIHTDSGTMRDFREFVREAHNRGLRVVTELVLNHTSDQHPWFQRARRAPAGSRWRNYYVWSDTPDRYREARIIFKDFEPSNWTWDPIAKAYYWHRFFAHQPDLNWENPEVKRVLFKTVELWLRMGVDGMRLDAVPYLFEEEGSNCENLPRTHEALRELRKFIDEKFSNRMLLAEANQWPEDAVAYFGSGDECNMCFHFPIMPRLFMSIQMEDRFPIIDILEQTPPIPEGCQWAIFLRNHDELTLEMVTDEERDYMYRVYALDPAARINLGIRRRLAPLLGNDRRKIELMNGLLLSLPGTPVVYYGDEIGMGDNFFLGDRNGVRTPMQWSNDRNAGFSRANPQRLYLPVIIDPEYHYETVNVDAQQNNPNSLLWWTKRIIALRKRYRAFGRGTIEFLLPRNSRVLAYVRRYGEELILVVANLSRFVQYVELDLTAFKGRTPVELFGTTRFPPVVDSHYLLTLAPHAFYWFSLEPQRVDAAAALPEKALPALAVTGEWENVLSPKSRPALEHVLLPWLKERAWFVSHDESAQAARIVEITALPRDSGEAHLAFVQVEYASATPETYLVPLGFAPAERAPELLARTPWAAIAALKWRGKAATPDGLLYDAGATGELSRDLVEAITRRKTFQDDTGVLAGLATPALRDLDPQGSWQPSVTGPEQASTLVACGDKLVLKLMRRVEEGLAPELEVAQKTRFAHMLPVAGWVEKRKGRRSMTTLAILYGNAANEGTAWKHVLDGLGRFYDTVLTRTDQAGHTDAPPPIPGKPLALAASDVPAAARETIGTGLELARLLGQRTAEMHVALAGVADDPAFASEPFGTLQQRSMYQSMRNLTGRTMRLLRDRTALLPKEAQTEATRLLGMQTEILSVFRAIMSRKMEAGRIRAHGNYHLANVLWTGKDFVVRDFEGETVRPFGERRLRVTPLRDVARMLGSFRYATLYALTAHGGRTLARPVDIPSLEPWSDYWYLWTAAVFLSAYLQHARQGGFLPASQQDLDTLLDVHVLGEAVEQLSQHLQHRQELVRIPMQTLFRVLQEARTS